MADATMLALLASSKSTLISQGAEAKVYKAYLESSDFPALQLQFDNDKAKLSNSYLKHPRSAVLQEDLLTRGHIPVLLKYRFAKAYRHPSLDASLTKSRVAGEARALVKCSRAGVNVPAIRFIDAPAGVLGLEWIEGSSVRRLLPDDTAEGDDETAESENSLTLNDFGLTLDELMVLIGTEIAKMHLADVIHGDLTTSNMMLRSINATDKNQSSQLVLIDFGLSYVSSLVEDQAVDLYVLERAFVSTHPEPEQDVFDQESPDEEPTTAPPPASTMFSKVLSAYEKKMGGQWTQIGKRLDDVRLRGRKRSMLG